MRHGLHAAGHRDPGPGAPRGTADAVLRDPGPQCRPARPEVPEGPGLALRRPAGGRGVHDGPPRAAHPRGRQDLGGDRDRGPGQPGADVPRHQARGRPVREAPAGHGRTGGGPAQRQVAAAAHPDPGPVQERGRHRPGRDERRRARHPHRRPRPRGQRRPARRPQGLPAPRWPHRARRRVRPGRHPRHPEPAPGHGPPALRRADPADDHAGALGRDGTDPHHRRQGPSGVPLAGSAPTDAKGKPSGSDLAFRGMGTRPGRGKESRKTIEARQQAEARRAARVRRGV